MSKELKNGTGILAWIRTVEILFIRLQHEHWFFADFQMDSLPQFLYRNAILLPTPCFNVALNSGVRASTMWINIENGERGKSLVITAQWANTFGPGYRCCYCEKSNIKWTLTCQKRGMSEWPENPRLPIQNLDIRVAPSYCFHSFSFSFSFFKKFFKWNLAWTILLLKGIEWEVGPMKNTNFILFFEPYWALMPNPTLFKLTKPTDACQRWRCDEICQRLRCDHSSIVQTQVPLTSRNTVNTNLMHVTAIQIKNKSNLIVKGIINGTYISRWQKQQKPYVLQLGN